MRYLLRILFRGEKSFTNYPYKTLILAKKDVDDLNLDNDPDVINYTLKDTITNNLIISKDA